MNTREGGTMGGEQAKKSMDRVNEITKRTHESLERARRNLAEAEKTLASWKVRSAK